jgi:hypothetical protein
MFMTWHALVSFNAFCLHLCRLNLGDINAWLKPASYTAATTGATSMKMTR